MFKKLLFASALLCLSLPSMARLDRMSKKKIANYICGDDKTCARFTKRHLVRDLLYCQIHPQYVDQLPDLMIQNGKTEEEPRGRVAFLGFAPFPYRYKVKVDDYGEVTVSASVYFTNIDKLTNYQLEQMQIKLDNAARKFEIHSPYPYKLNFKFEITWEKKGASVRTKLIPGYTRGPYFSKWSMRWGYNTVAHEMGHVMGLDDEYHNGLFPTVFSNCDRTSLMCTSGKPYPYHYYVIMRRALCFI